MNATLQYGILLLGYATFLGILVHGSQHLPPPFPTNRVASPRIEGRRHAENARKAFREPVLEGAIPQDASFLVNAFQRWNYYHALGTWDGHPECLAIPGLRQHGYSKHFARYIMYMPEGWITSNWLVERIEALSLFQSRFPHVPIRSKRRVHTASLAPPPNDDLHATLPGDASHANTATTTNGFVKVYQIWMGEHCKYYERRFVNAPKVALVDRCFVILVTKG